MPQFGKGDSSMGQRPQEIPAKLADQLERGVHRVLAHPSRRQILRALSAEGQRMSTVQLGAFTGASCSPSCTAYHARLLEDTDLIAQVGSEAAEGKLTFFYSSLIGGDPLLLAVLQATRSSDHEHLALAAAT
jgi:hypothetical protein